MKNKSLRPYNPALENVLAEEFNGVSDGIISPLRTQRMFIAYKFPSLNDFIGANRANAYMGNKMKKELTDLAASVARRKIVRTDVKCDYRFDWFENDKRRDPDNVSSAVKYIFDGMVKAGVIPRDSAKYVGSIEHHFHYASGVPGVVVAMEPVE